MRAHQTPVGDTFLAFSHANARSHDLSAWAFSSPLIVEPNLTPGITQIISELALILNTRHISTEGFAQVLDTVKRAQSFCDPYRPGAWKEYHHYFEVTKLDRHVTYELCLQHSLDGNEYLTSVKLSPIADRFRTGTLLQQALLDSVQTQTDDPASSRSSKRYLALNANDTILLPKDMLQKQVLTFSKANGFGSRSDVRIGRADRINEVAQKQLVKASPDDVVMVRGVDSDNIIVTAFRSYHGFVEYATKYPVDPAQYHCSLELDQHVLTIKNEGEASFLVILSGERAA